MGIIMAGAFLAGCLGSVVLFSLAIISKAKVRPQLGLQRWLAAVLAGVASAALALGASYAGYPKHWGGDYSGAIRFAFVLSLSPGIAVAGTLAVAILLGRRLERRP